MSEVPTAIPEVTTVHQAPGNTQGISRGNYGYFRGNYRYSRGKYHMTREVTLPLRRISTMISPRNECSGKTSSDASMTWKRADKRSVQRHQSSFRVYVYTILAFGENRSGNLSKGELLSFVFCVWRGYTLLCTRREIPHSVDDERRDSQAVYRCESTHNIQTSNVFGQGDSPRKTVTFSNKELRQTRPQGIDNRREAAGFFIFRGAHA